MPDSSFHAVVHEAIHFSLQDTTRGFATTTGVCYDDPTEDRLDNAPIPDYRERDCVDNAEGVGPSEQSTLR